MSLFDSAVTSGFSAPFWFVEFFKTLGFALHLIPIGILLAGIPFAGLLWLLGDVNSKRLAQRLFQQAPVFMAFGINFAIVPLLFVQLGYSKVFYSTTIILAAHWAGLLLLVFLAYLACYLCASGARREKKWSTLFFACVASGCLLGVGLIFSSVWTLFERPYELERLRELSSYSFNFLGQSLTLGGNGTASGLAVYWGNPASTADPVVFLRFAGILGLAFHSLGFWIVFDAFYLYRGPRVLTDEEELRLLEAKEALEQGKKVKQRLPIQEDPTVYSKRVISVACFLVVLGLLIAVPSLVEYIIRRLQFVAESAPNTFTHSILLWGTLTSLVLPFFFLVLAKFNKLEGKTLAFCLTFCELLLVGFYAALRQAIQNIQLSPYYVPKEFETIEGIEWSPIFVFLGVLVLVLTWIAVLVSLMAKSSDSSNKGLSKPKKQKAPKKSKKDKKKDISPSKATPQSNGRASDLTIGTRPTHSNNPQTKKGSNLGPGKQTR